MRIRSLFPFPARGAMLCAALAATLTTAVAAPPVVAAIDSDEIVFDRSQAEWSEAYLQWIATFARGGSPISDATGAACATRQEGEVWFLATSDGTGPVVRSCVVPVGRTLFVPIVSTMERSGNREPDCESMARIAADNISHRVSGLAMSVDGLAVDNLPSYRAATRECFALGARQVPRVAARTAVADGYYVMLKPLAAGAHTVVVGARFDGASLSTTYRLEVR